MLSHLEVSHVSNVGGPLDSVELEQGAALSRQRRHLHRPLDIYLRLGVSLKKEWSVYGTEQYK
jgi:hypothetical protein